MTEQKKRGLLRRYRDTIIASVALMASVGYPNVAMYLNPPPADGRTEMLSGVISRAQRQHSNILLQMPDGSEEALDFPGDLQGIYMAKWATFSVASAEEFASLKGCKADIQIDRLRWVFIPTNPRIWSIRCDRFSVPYNQIVEHYYNGANLGGLRWIIVLGSFGVLLILFYGDFIQGRK